MKLETTALYSDEYWMQQALLQAKLAYELEEVPVGAVIVHQNQMIGQGFNCPISSVDPTAHAEIQAIRDACKNIDNYRLPKGSTIYVTLEPCTQCIGALVHARIDHMVFATPEPRAGSLISAQQLMKKEFFNHYFSYQSGVLSEQSASLLRDFFKQRRLKRLP